MALTLGNPTTISATVRNSQADAFDDDVNSGTGTAALRLRNASTTVLVSFGLQNPAFGAASSGQITLQGTTLSATASAGSADSVSDYQILDRDGNVLLTGGVTGSDTITSGQTVNLTSFTITWPSS